MLKWLVVMIVVLVALGLAWPLLSRLGLGRLPGDWQVVRKGKKLYFPIATSLILSLALTLLFRVLRI